MSLFGKNRITTDGIDGDEMLSDDVEMETDLTEDEIDPTDDGGSNKKKRKKKKGGFKIVLAVIACLVLVWFVVGIFVGPTDRQCREKVEDFQSACNSLSANALLDCMHPAIATPAKLAVMAAGAITDTRPDDWLPQLVSYMGSGISSITKGTDLDLTDVFRQMKLTVRRVGLPGRTRRVRCRLTAGVVSQDVYIYFRKSRGTTYIQKIRLVK